MLVARNITLSFNLRDIFNNLSFNINKDQRIGLVGRNGSGKSTLLKVLSGQQNIDSGQILIEKAVKIAYFPQEVVLVSDRAVLDETLTTFGPLADFNNEFILLKRDFESERVHSNEKLEHFAFLQKELSDHNFDQLIIDTKKMLTWLGFDSNKLDKPVSQLSVGWKMRIVLAKLLLQNADFYLFDEPTNHLDIVAKDWFLDFLKHANFGFVLISHDRFFLDNLCEYIFDLNNGNLKIYRGNFSKYVEQKQKDDAILQVQYEAQQKHFKKTMETINRFKAKASKASMAQSMLKSLEKIEMIEIESGPPEIKLNFSNVKRAGEITLTVEDVSKSFDSTLLFKHVSFNIKRGDKVGIVAANGKGKTTLLNLIAGKYALESGSVKFGHNVEVAFFEQDQEISLNKNRTILEEVESVCVTSEMRQRVRGMLGAFLFSGDDVEKKVGVLSGGEKNRVAMVKILLQNANFLILDEPTNHLDIQTKDILLKALNQYPGTILFVSHDRTFIDGLASRILELGVEGIIDYPGNYESYLYHKKHDVKQLPEDGNKSGMQSSLSVEHSMRSNQQSSKEWYDLRKNISSIERKIASHEKELAELSGKFEFIEYGSNNYESAQLRINQLKTKLESFYKNWEEFQEKFTKFQ
ncbi:MAG: ATPase component of ABC transporter with duplicated ATPase domain [candidate division TM6 bacterium GW2011_GWF2_37_49]|nr:MAG: ATPase component of ABC transporter with duplicated ATPase domain [candidate division TM6 bacterium GW2011_GWF2_37_49]